ncbi:hypothetical protein LWP59_25890 [Amycolatopsis acidiphila]|uniref:DUF2267 domain-containing protein n=1 Tax=Amycolatopsis acidiphila TaxID=715473 RepID=A0A558ADN5_9PSEU|nr:hypothetical protein [Amycolatopsis acidiphila]TVT22371.1 hypothetical protein FNH06_13305 [Amycolatopsis acidiphila]UIJ57567.1 hypothetical protein LWP59_25890 [Amycolatopsis acidiphila]GHG89534.1 hypothetical protein GCM10017788_64350 [Amycolatopsis acidiphila]
MRKATVTVGLLADPGLPAEVARDLVEELPDALREHVSDGVAWQVRLRCEPLVLDEDGNIPIVELARRERQRRECDLMVCVTDLPRHAGVRPVIADLSRTHGVALASLPAIGGIRLRAQLRKTLLHLAGELGRGTVLPEHVIHTPAAGPIAPVRLVDSPEDGIDSSLALVGLRGQLRLLFGMVRDNRPWRLVPSLSRALAAAAATAAFGVFYGSIWAMSDALSPTRLAVINLFAIAAMVVWLIAHNDLWERRRRQPRGENVLYNASTVATLSVGVACMYALLFAVVVLAALAVISGPYLAKTLGHPAGFGDYLMLAWLASSMGTIGGALGSSLESEDAVREATYSKREQERRARRRRDEETGSAEQEAA